MGQPRVLNSAELQYIITRYRACPVVYKDKVCYGLWEDCDVNVSLTNISRILEWLGMEKKKLSKSAAECNELTRAAYEACMGGHNYHHPDLFVFVDKSAFDNHVADRTQGRAFEGKHAGLHGLS
jgi:hypothetical protein